MILRTQDGTWCCTKVGGVAEVVRKDGSKLTIADDVYEVRRPDGLRVVIKGQRAQSFALDLGRKYDRGESLKDILAELWKVYA